MTLAQIGRSSIQAVEYVGGLSIQFGRGLAAAARLTPFRTRLRWRNTIRQMEIVGVGALPVVCLIAGFVGLIMALQGAYELKKFGALSYVVSLVGVSLTRELGPLMTAIIVIGRSGSAFAAEIGTMTVTEEVDALRTMALEPVDFLLAPKLVAMMIMMPCLTIAADTAGILGGAVFTYASLGMGLRVYLSTTAEVLLLRDIITGLIKSLAFGMIIVQVGCFEGFHVQGGPEGVGRATTRAVVQAIFLVVLADLVFTAFFYLFWS
ncbi:MAG TPA: ABC transporter permease [Bryobacterales bacterium]|jgi:phospholipid/cholesterol/gamma-HCH transport system permease protein|nr:ABC transporter permease [Bryobacterales bacterium]